MSLIGIIRSGQCGLVPASVGPGEIFEWNQRDAVRLEGATDFAFVAKEDEVWMLDGGLVQNESGKIIEGSPAGIGNLTVTRAATPIEREAYKILTG